MIDVPHCWGLSSALAPGRENRSALFLVACECLHGARTVHLNIKFRQALRLLSYRGVEEEVYQPIMERSPMWPFRRNTRYKKPGRAPFDVVYAWPWSKVRAPIWVNGNCLGGKKVTYSIRKKVPKSATCPSGYSTVFEEHEANAVALCACKVRRRIRELKKAKVI